MKHFLVFLIFTFVLSIVGCESMCANVILQELPSPDKKLKAVIFQRYCGATTGFSTQVTILKYDEKLHKAKGNVFSADTDLGKVPGGLDGGRLVVEAVWKDPRHLQIMHTQNARILSAAKKIEVSLGIFKSEVIQITYSPIN